MTDDSGQQAPGASGWTAPGASAVPPPPPAFPAVPPPPFGATAPPPPAFGTATSGAPAPHEAPRGWTPPPKPGLIPLRPLDLGTMMGAAFRVLRRNPRPTFGIALLVQGAVALVTAGMIGLVTFLTTSRVSMAAEEDLDAVMAGMFGTLIVSGVVTLLVGMVAAAWLQGIIVLEVSRASLGEKLTLRQLWRLARGRLAALVGWSLLTSLAAMLAIGIVIGLVWAMVATMGPAGIAGGIVIGLFGGLGLVVLAVWIGTKLSLVPSALMIERVSLISAVRRSWRLTNQAFWRTFGIQLLVWAIVSMAMNVILVPFSIIAPMLLFLLDPNGTNSAIAGGAAAAVYVVQLVFSVMLGAIAAVIQTATAALIYLDLRMRREALDLELSRFVERRQADHSYQANPYLRLADGGPTAPASSVDSPWL